MRNVVAISKETDAFQIVRETVCNLCWKVYCFNSGKIKIAPKGLTDFCAVL